MTSVSEISARDWSPKLGDFGEVVTNIDDIAQCLRIIFTTRIGSVPMRRKFGSKIHRSLDKPFAVAQANLPIDILEAAQWEPRAVINGVTVSRTSDIAALTVTIDWSEGANGAPQTLTLTGQELTNAVATDDSALNSIAAKVAGMIGGGTTDTNDFMRKSEYASTKPGTVLAAERLRGNSPNGTEYETEFENDGRITTTP